MPLNIFKILFPEATMEHFMRHKVKSFAVCTYNKISTTQLGVCSITRRHKNKDKLYRLFVVPGDGPEFQGCQPLRY